jgi:hypothetical protein
MLEQLNDNLCVSQFPAKGNPLWACYEPMPCTNQKKRKAWKPVTGLMSVSEMCSFLDRHYDNRAVATEFIRISSHPRQQ